MKNITDKFTYRVVWSEPDSEYVGLCSEFPGLSWLEPTMQGALDGIVNLVNEVVADMLENSEKIPEALALHEYSGKFLVRVPPHVHRDLTIEAAEQGVSLNRLVSSRLAREPKNN